MRPREGTATARGTERILRSLHLQPRANSAGLPRLLRGGITRPGAAQSPAAAFGALSQRQNAELCSERPLPCLPASFPPAPLLAAQPDGEEQRLHVPG